MLHARDRKPSEHLQEPSDSMTASRARQQRQRGRLFACVMAILLGMGLAGATVQADSYDERRVRTAARLVRALLTAHEGLAAMQQNGGGLEVLVWGEQERHTKPLLTLIAPPVRGGPTLVSGLELRARADTELPASDAIPPVAIFLSEKLDDEAFSRLLAWCIAHGVILYSPFEGDVERGATAGVSIQAKVQPLVNLDTLRSSGIALRRFYLDHSKVVP